MYTYANRKSQNTSWVPLEDWQKYIGARALACWNILYSIEKFTIESRILTVFTLCHAQDNRYDTRLNMLFRS